MKNAVILNIIHNIFNLLYTYSENIICLCINRFETKLYDKRDGITFPIVNFPFISNTISASPTYGVYISQLINYSRGGRLCRDRIIVGFTTTYAISAYHHCEFESRSGRGVQHYVIKFVSDLRQVGGFLQVFRFPPPIKLTATNN